MKIYNKKGLLSGVICTLLGVWSIFWDFGNSNHNLIVQIRDGHADEKLDCVMPDML